MQKQWKQTAKYVIYDEYIYYKNENNINKTSFKVEAKK
jgi:hypothetical protein